MMLALSDIHKMASYLKMTQGDHLTHAEATNRLRKHWPSFGEDKGDERGERQDHALPYELKLRLNDYMSNVGAHGIEDLKMRAERFSSFNAFVRSEIEAGRL